MMDGYPVITHRCPEHREVIPMRSVIVRDYCSGVVS